MSEKIMIFGKRYRKNWETLQMIDETPHKYRKWLQKKWRMSPNNHWKVIARISTNDLGKNRKFCTGIIEKILHFGNDRKNSQFLKRATVKILTFSNRKKIVKQLLNKNVNFLEWLWETFYFDNRSRKKSRISSN